nr:DUF4270 domain-containing protein [uncultured Flavobacterium sp.]
MYNTSFFKKILLLATVAIFYSCDKEFNSIGDDLIGDNHFDLEAEDYSVTAYNQKVTPVASNNLPINALGIYDNPVFGTTTASFNTQVTLTSYPPSLGFEAVIDSVTLNIPYFIDATKTTTSAEGKTTYVLDSIYGPETGIIKLSVYESGILLNNYNANNYDISQFYNTDRNSDFLKQATTNPTVFGERLNNSTNTAENDQFFFSSKPIIEKTAATTTTPESSKTIDPEMRLHLNKDFFKAKIFDAPASKLAAPDVFKNYFKGLYFNVEKSGTSAGRMAMMNFIKGKITVFYKAKTTATDTAAESKTLVINLAGSQNNVISTVSLLEESNPASDYTSATTNDDTPDERLYLKGGQGSMAVIELFDKTDLIHYDDKGKPVNGSNGVYDELDEIRNNVTHKNWLANEANLVFTIDTQKMGTGSTDPKTAIPEPNRIYLYDLENNTVIADHVDDRTPAPNNDPKKSRTVLGGIINLDANKRGTTYKIRITNHIRNIIKNADVKNVKLGLVVTEDINTITSAKLDKTKTAQSIFSEIPVASVMNPLGTVLFGSNIPEGDDNYAKRVKLQIYYTKLNNK